ncbi:MAG: NYN domain-containing protein [Verrucomicrobiae bacterium]|nr:NYN domain-containing protein [Verrucomicrobiae bacterium]MDW8307953.1 NYN domain-containing protein [Verrucomicrobiales bacterium]
MALVRILVDGYSLLHAWPQLARGQPRHTAAAREELIRVLARYQDAAGTPVTVVFDGPRSARRLSMPEDVQPIEVLFSGAGRTADDLIERAVHRFQPFGEVLVVTDDIAERDLVIGMGGSAWPCATFIAEIENAFRQLDQTLQRHNRREQARFRHGK